MTDVEGQEPETESPDNFPRDVVEGLRKEAASWRTKLRESEQRSETLAAKLKEWEDKDKSELERLTAEKTRLEQELTQRQKELVEGATNTAIKLAAAQSNVIDPEAVAALIDRSEIDYRDGQVTGVEKALKKLLKDKPYLVKEETPPPPVPGAGGQPLNSSAKNIDEQFLGLIQTAKNE